MKVERINSSVSFRRKPNQQEMQVYTKAVNQGLNLLGKQIDLIIHNPSIPSLPKENVGIGSLLSNGFRKMFFPFLKEHGITGIQQEPSGIREPGSFSPYSPQTNAKSAWMIPLEKLTSDDYGNILSKKSFNFYVKSNNKNNTKVNYPYVGLAYKFALKEAYDNFKAQEENPLKFEFEQFKLEKGKDFEVDSIFTILSDKYGTQEWKTWPNSLDKRLFAPTPELKEDAEKRLAEIKKEHKDEIDQFIFEQMIIARETKKLNEEISKDGIKVIGDAPIGLPLSMEWQYQDLFLEDTAVGCPTSETAAKGTHGQKWGLGYFKPELLFNKDGSLGPAGELLKKRYRDYFADCPGGVRIDHVIGCIDPFLYKVSKEDEPWYWPNAGRPYSQEGSKYQKHNVEEFANIMTKIIIPAAEEYGLTKDDLLCEELGHKSHWVKDVMDYLQLPKINLTLYGRAANSSPNDSISQGVHDDKSLLEYIDSVFERKYNGRIDSFYRKVNNLADDTAPEGIEWYDLDNYKNCLAENKTHFLTASFTELFASPAKRVQIFFTNLFGIRDRYNEPGTVKGNWELRLPDTFETDYYRNVRECKAPNFAQSILDAMRHRGLDRTHPELAADLEKSAQILYE